MRIAGELSAGTAAAAWLFERLLDIDSRIDLVVNTLASHALPAAVPLLPANLSAF